jgi:iron-sulfur cluster repair protein YtfE (RIC family)
MFTGGFYNMQEFATKTIREIALEAPLTTRVFEEFKIDFCCGGRVPFAEACEMASTRL